MRGKESSGEGVQKCEIWMSTLKTTVVHITPFFITPVTVELGVFTRPASTLAGDISFHSCCMLRVQKQYCRVSAKKTCKTEGQGTFLF